MTYKFIAQAYIRSQHGYIRDIPESAIFYNIKKDDSGEVWYIMIPSKDFYNPLAIDWKGKSCDFFACVDIGEWVVLYTKDLVSDNWTSVSKDEFYSIFSSVFDNIYFYDRFQPDLDERDTKVVEYYIDFINDFAKNFTNTNKVPDSIPDLYRAYKLLDITPDGKLEVVRVTNNKNEYSGIEKLTISLDFKDIPRSYVERHNKIELSHNGDEFWEEFNKCLKSFIHDIEIYNK